MELKSEEGFTPFLSACVSEIENIDVLELIADKGCDLTAVANNGCCAVYLAADA